MVVFSGTSGSSLENWIHNLMATRTQANLPGMPDDAKVHDGFYRSWTRSLLQKQVTEAVQDILKERGVVPVLVVGHSLGGALATLCAAELMYTYNLTDVQLYTFGSPRVGNAAFAEALRNSTLDHTKNDARPGRCPDGSFRAFGLPSHCEGGVAEDRPGRQIADDTLRRSDL